MIAIVISEKGGAERRNQYPQGEITIGRVKGNDVLLPKGNVSKRHARLILRDGRYIVTDLKSTNGTYVNHRRITHATLVREGDRIYIGDFVLRIEDSFTRSSEHPSFVPDSPDASAGRSSHGSPTPARPTTVRPDELQDVVSHFPIEHDPDESSPSLAMPRPPRVPSGLKTSRNSSSPASTTDPQTNETYSSSPRGSGPVGTVSSQPHKADLLHASDQPDTNRQLRETLHMALEGLISSVENELGVDTLHTVEPAAELVTKIEAAIAAEIERLDAPLSDLEKEELSVAAHAELAELGPIGALLADEQITRVQVMLRRVTVDRRGDRVSYEGMSFGTESGVARAMVRLCARAGVDASDVTNSYLQGTLDGGRELFAVRPPASPDGHLIIVRRKLRRTASLNSLVRSGGISRGMATLLDHCVTARANLLITGARERGADQLVEALAAAAPKRHRTVWLHDPGDALPEGTAHISLGDTDESRDAAIAAAAHLCADHLVVPPLGGQCLAHVLDNINRGTEGVIMSTTAETLRKATDRICADLAATRPGLTPQTAREWLGATFDLGLEVTQLRDGRRRVVRLVEFRSSQQGIHMRDIFTFTYHRTATGGSIEGAFYASGTVPRIVEDLSARGMPLDQSIFRRHPSA